MCFIQRESFNPDRVETTLQLHDLLKPSQEEVSVSLNFCYVTIIEQVYSQVIVETEGMNSFKGFLMMTTFDISLNMHT